MTENFFKHYRPADYDRWTGRNDGEAGERFFQCVSLLDLNEQTVSVLRPGSTVIIGFCSDTGVIRNQGRPGANKGPDHLRAALSNLAVPSSLNTLVDLGNIHCLDDDLENAQAALGELIALVLSQQLHPLVFGGGHETAFGHYQGIAHSSYAHSLGIINLDAHYDLRPVPESGLGNSGTPFTQIAALRHNANLPFDYCCIGIQDTANTASLKRTAEQLGVITLTARETIENQAHALNSVQAFMDAHDHLYLTFCLDVFAAEVAPGVSAPQVLGLYPFQVLPFLSLIMNSGKVCTLDVVELSPEWDQGNRTAKLAAECLARTCF